MCTWNVYTVLPLLDQSICNGMNKDIKEIYIQMIDGKMCFSVIFCYMTVWQINNWEMLRKSLNIFVEKKLFDTLVKPSKTPLLCCCLNLEIQE